MKSVTTREAIEGFETLAALAHSGETVLVVHSGRPWVKLVSAAPGRGKSVRQIQARLDRISPKPIPGATDGAATSSPVTTYFDTSYLVALYVPNDHTAAALRHRARAELIVHR